MNDAPPPLNLLLVEDCEAEAVLLLREIRRGGLEVRCQRVDTREAMQAALKSGSLDLVISDYEMPDFNGLEALRLCKEHDPNLPCIIVTGHVGEEIAVETIKAGADDYLLKDNLIRLVPAIQRVLRDSEASRALSVSEKARRESETRYRVLFESSMDALMTLEPPSWGFVSGNPATVRLFGAKDEQEFTSKKPWELSPKRQPDGRLSSDKARETIETAMLRGSHSFEWTHRRLNGQDFPATVLLTRMELGGKQFLQATVRDITDRKLAEIQKENLLQADKMVTLGTMVSGVAHEINNPNNFIMLTAPVLADIWNSVLPILDEYHRAHGDFVVGGLNYSEIRDEVPTLLAGIKNGSERIKAIVADLKRFARLEPMELAEAVDINEIARSAVSLMGNTLRKATDRFTVEYGEGLPPIKGSFQKIEQVVINLLSNACEALTARTQAVTLTTAVMEGSVRITVCDEGMGMSENQMSHLTDPFFTTKRDSGGTGLGLSVSSGIVKDHGGTMSFRSEPGKGTTAVVRLPVSGHRC